MSGGLRIIGGAFKGRKLPSVVGSARPTGARQREMLFNILLHHPEISLQAAHILDCFCGSGALGLEALSRGAAFVTFLDSDGLALERIRAAAQAWGCSDACTYLRSDALYPPQAIRPADVIFMDAPFSTGLTGPALNALLAQGWLGPNASVIAELPQPSRQGQAKSHPISPSVSPPALVSQVSALIDQLPDSLRLFDHRRSGSSEFVFIQKA